MKETWKILKLGIYVFALPLVATAAASAHQWMTSNTALAIVPPVPAVAMTAPIARITAVRNHTITLNADGEVQGRVAAINFKSKVPRGLSEVNVYFSQNGRVVRKGYTNDDGTFVVKGLKEGVYSFVATNDLSFATCGVNVIQGKDGAENFIEVASISPNIKAVRDILKKEGPAPVDNEAVAAETTPKNVAGSNRVELDGQTLRGQVVSLIKDELSTGTKAHLFKANEQVAEFEIKTDGTFEVADVAPGVYDIVVSGPEGVAAVSFEAVAPIDESSTDAYTALQDALFTNFLVALAPQFDGGIGGGSDAVVYDSSPVSFAGDSIGDGCAGGGCSGGAGDFSSMGDCCGGSSGGRFLGGRGLLFPLIAAAIAIPLAVGGGGPESPSEP